MDHVLGGIRRTIEVNEVPVDPALWASGHNYIGNDTLWLDLPRDGTVHGKSVSIIAYEIVEGGIVVSARALDPHATASAAIDQSNYHRGGGPNDRAITITFPTPGCWEVTYQLGGRDLRFVLAVEAR